MLLVVIFTAVTVSRCHGWVPCICDTGHPESKIMECPSTSSKLIGIIYSFVNHLLPVKDDAHCKQFARGIHTPYGWIPVIHAGKVGYMVADAGLKYDNCSWYEQKGPFQQYNCGYSTTVTTTIQTPTTTTAATTTVTKITTTNAPTTTTTAPTTAVPKTSTTKAPTTKTTTTATTAPTTAIPKTMTTNAPPTTKATTPGPTTTVRVQTTTAVITDKLTTTVTVDHSIGAALACNNLGIFKDFVSHMPVKHNLSRICPNGNYEFEAPIQKHCDAPTIDHWVKRTLVPENCQRIPVYTPIALFLPGMYIPVDGAFFLSCDDKDQITVLKQACGHTGLTKEVLTVPQYYYTVGLK